MGDTGPVRGARRRTGAPRRPRPARPTLEARPLVSCCGTRSTPPGLDWPPGRWPVVKRWRDQLRGVQAPPGCGAGDRCGPAGESMS